MSTDYSAELSYRDIDGQIDVHINPPDLYDEDVGIVFVTVNVEHSCCDFSFRFDVRTDYARGTHTNEDICYLIARGKWPAADHPLEDRLTPALDGLNESSLKYMLSQSVSSQENFAWRNIHSDTWSLTFCDHDICGIYRSGEQGDIALDDDIIGAVMDEVEKLIGKWREESDAR